ncbi:CCCH zinc finger DNA binding protein [Fusarium avenaceum]|nr:CCCH zinc finger DNA binding protein [Fusarium avenaceum]
MKVEIEGLQQRWDACKAHDDEKHAIITALLAHVDAQSNQLSKINSELEDKNIVIKAVKKDKEVLEGQVETLQQERDRHAFVFVIIDGDCMLFRDELVQAGLEGGKQAMSLLKQSVEKKLKTLSGSVPPHLQIIIRVYANLQGLSQSYQNSDLLSNGQTLEEFVRGFNMGDPLCDYVDAGNGKECADEKVKALFRHHLDDVHCRHVFFGASADNGYARLLGPYAQDNAHKQRICLIEGPPFGSEIADLVPKFEHVSFDVFRKSQQLPNTNRRVSSASSSNYANAARKTPSPSTQGAVLSSQERSPTKILRNINGERLDSKLNYDQHTLNLLRGRKLCNNYALLGKCPFKSSYGSCIHTHNQDLSEREKNALRAIARMSPCPTGSGCSDGQCLLGHVCTKPKCTGLGCRFPEGLHNINNVVASEQIVI